MQYYRILILLFFLALVPSAPSTGAPNEDLVVKAEEMVLSRNFNRALLLFSEAIERDPNKVEAYLGRANVYLLMDRYGDADRDYATALKINPELVKSYFDKKKHLKAEGS